MLTYLKRFTLNKDLEPRSVLLEKLTIISLVLLLVQDAIGWALNYPLSIHIFMLAVVLNTLAILFFLYLKWEVFAKLYFLSTSYLIIASLTYIFGYSLNTHLYLIPGIGMPLLFFHDEIGNKKWVFVFFGIPVWLVIELWVRHLTPVLTIPPALIPKIGQLNIGFTLVTSFSMFYFFSKRFNDQMQTVAEEKAKAENSVKRLTQFNYLLTHDLKSPLGTIHSMLKLINDGKLNEAEKAEFLQVLTDKSGATYNLVQGITLYFRETASQTPSWENTKDIINEVVSLLTVPPNFKITIGELPLLYLNKIAIRQMAQNMITNALKYNDKAEGILHIYYTEEKEIGKICFKDNGVGMTATQQKKAFELYTLFHKMAENESSGMGLAVAKELMESNGGFIEVESEPGEGSEFKLCFPLNHYKHQGLTNS